MSNILKSVYFNVDMQDKHIIDSNDLMEKIVPELQAAQQQEEEPFTFHPIQLGQPLDQSTQDFSDGLSVIHMDEVREEERRKLSKEITEETKEQVQLLLDGAHAEADEILAKAKEEAEQIRSSAEEEGRAAGMEMGFAKAREQAQEMERQLQQTVSVKLQEIEEQKEQMEPFFAGLVADLVEKITGIACKEKQDVIVHLIRKALQNIEKPKQITLRVSKDDMAVVSHHKNELKEDAGDALEFDIVEDASLQANQCMIETESKIVDCSLDAQLENLRNQIKLLAM